MNTRNRIEELPIQVKGVPDLNGVMPPGYIKYAGAPP